MPLVLLNTFFYIHLYKNERDEDKSVCVWGGGRFEHLGVASVVTSQQVSACVESQESKITGDVETSVCVFVCVYPCVWVCVS